jgi:hypothetical protein
MTTTVATGPSMVKSSIAAVDVRHNLNFLKKM